MAAKVWANLEVLTAAQQNVVAAQADDALKPAGNLAGLANAATARANLGLGNSATRDTGTTAGTVAAGDDARITGATQKASNLSDLPSAATARGNLGLAAVAASADYDDLVNRPVVETAETGGLQVTDEYGEVTFEITPAGLVAVSGMSFGGGPAEYAIAIADGYGEVVGFVTPAGVGGGVLGGGDASAQAAAAAAQADATAALAAAAAAQADVDAITAAASVYSTKEQIDRATRALALSASVIGQTNTTAARPVWTYSHVISYGQSLSNGWEGWPSLSKTQPFDSLMVGDSVHPSSESSSTWTATGTAAFNPLIATVHDGSGIVNDATVAGYSAGNVARGETVLEGAVNGWRKQQLAWRGLLSDATRRLVGTACGVGGKSIEQLSKGASPELFNRLRGAANATKTLATTASGTYGVTAVLWLQGEHNSAYATGTSDRATYKALQATLQADVTADIATTIAGQTAPPAFFCYQTSATAVSDALFLSIPQAQLESALELNDWYLVTPSYPVTDKALHLDPNGYRWLGQQFGKVMHQVLDLGRGWKPVHPLRATWRATKVLIDFHVPHPPLQFQPVYVVLAATTYAAKGFKVTDDIGTVTITNVEIVGGACVLITLGRDLSTNPYVWYGDKTVHNGNGNLCDSDPTIASDDYEWTTGTGQYAGAEIAALEDKPYPLWNWCCLFRMAIEPDPAE